MFFAALPMLGFFVLLWIPPTQGSPIWSFAYLATMLGLYRIAYVFFYIPYDALLPELGTTDHQRVQMSAWNAAAQSIGMILAGLAGVLVEIRGYAQTALLYAAVALPSFYVPFLSLRERPKPQMAKIEGPGFWESLLAMLRNPAFRSYTVAWALYWTTTALVATSLPYVGTEICLLSESGTVYLYLSAVVATFACYPLVTWLSNRLGKWRVYVGSMLSSAVALASLALIGDWIPVSLAVQGVVWVVLQAGTLSGVLVLSLTFAAEVTDHHASLTGQRREGVHYAVWRVLDTMITGAGAALVPLLFVLGRSRTDPHGPLGVRMVGLVSSVMMVAAFLVFIRYPLRDSSASTSRCDPYSRRS
jgi:GPH family glycoside/pentoside/hexuronide:cation symporter